MIANAVLLCAWAGMTAYLTMAQLVAGRYHDRARMAAPWHRWPEES